MPLKTRWQRIVLLLLVAVPGVLIGREVIRLAMAARLANFFRAADLCRAIALDPADPSLYNQLGLVHLYSFDDLNDAEAIADFRHAVALNPHVALFWLNLSSACELSGNRACADEAIERAIWLSPITPRLRWAAGNYYLRAGESNAAWSEFRRLLQMAPADYAEATFSLCLRAYGDPRLLLDELLPAGSDPKVLLAYASFLLARDHVGEAFQAWTRAAGGPKPVSFNVADPYLEQLIALHRFPEGFAVWDDLVRQGSVVRPAASDPQNLVFNGGFEEKPLNAGFDWRSRDESYVSVDFSDPAPYQGSQCLRIDFTVGHNEEYQPVYQFVPVAANQEYALTALVRTDSITSDSGPRLRVEDPVCPACLDASTGTTIGTTPWHAVSLNFTTGPQTQVVQLSVWRPRSRSFPMEITGSFWLDDVVLKPMNSSQGGTS